VAGREEKCLNEWTCTEKNCPQDNSISRTSDGGKAGNNTVYFEDRGGRGKWKRFILRDKRKLGIFGGRKNY